MYPQAGAHEVPDGDHQVKDRWLENHFIEDPQVEVQEA